MQADLSGGMHVTRRQMTGFYVMTYRKPLVHCGIDRRDNPGRDFANLSEQLPCDPSFFPARECGCGFAPLFLGGPPEKTIKPPD